MADEVPVEDVTFAIGVAYAVGAGKLRYVVIACER